MAARDNSCQIFHSPRRHALSSAKKGNVCSASTGVCSEDSRSGGAVQLERAPGLLYLWMNKTVRDSVWKLLRIKTNSTTVSIITLNNR
ncbi:hypothetical protein Ddc_23241 [Ditylenchus destructor]|nr:hypothetical protein Ddc_23241 [Ditylenchus destructor]